MAYAEALAALLNEGRVTVGAEEAFSSEQLARGDIVLTDAERRWRLEMPGPPVVFDLEAARWGALQFYRICQFIVYRSIETETILDYLRREPARPLAAPTHYSVDLTLRYLPDLFRRAKTTSANDPLLPALLDFAHRWPLSAVGVAGLTGDRRLDPIWENESLRQLYADRVTKRRDGAALQDDRVREHLRFNLGQHTFLAGELASLLEPNTTDQADSGT